MLETMAALLFAHALADFVLQSDEMADHKSRPLTIALHVAVVLATASLALGTLVWPLLVFAFVHGLIDWLKDRFLGKNVTSFLLDQAAHFATILTFCVLVPEAWANGLWSSFGWLPIVYTYIGGFVFATLAGVPGYV